MAHAVRALLAVSLLIGTVAVTPVATRVEYWLINGPEYRQVGAHEFEGFRSSCLRIERRTYPDHVVQWHCYL